MSDVWSLALRIVIDIVIIVSGSIIVGAVAPRWPDAWLARDRGPLRLSRLDTPARYRDLRTPSLARRLPELGSTFGGDSKSRLPGTDRVSIEAYLREVRRAEWVHWASCLTLVPLWFFNPWWLALAFTVAVAGVNGLFILVLRHNRLRLRRILTRG